MPHQLTLAAIRTDGGTQMRADMDEATCRDYADLWKVSADFPPVEVFHDGSTYWLADGFHRFHGAREAGRKTIPANVRSGTQRDAILFAVGANQLNGLRRSNADKKRAVETLLNDTEWVRWSNREVALRAGVSDPFVDGVRKQLQTVSGSPAAQAKDAPRKGKDGKTRKLPTKAAPPSIIEPTGDCPKGGDHDFDSECCVKCLEPAPVVVRPKVKATFDDARINTALLNVQKLIGERATVYGTGDGYDACLEELDRLQTAFGHWQEATA